MPLPTWPVISTEAGATENTGCGPSVTVSVHVVSNGVTVPLAEKPAANGLVESPVAALARTGKLIAARGQMSAC